MTGEPVKVYLYDLSQGMAKQMSMSLTGKQIDGIWHTSVVVYDQEFYYGQGISIDKPGNTHHGRPLEIIDMGVTHLPLEVFIEYIESQRSVYTAERYHLLDFNCNTFSNDVCQFLTGSSIPKHITELPAEFLKTPFGQSLLPMIENMFGQSQLSSSTNNNNNNNNNNSSSNQLNNESLSLLQNVASSALSGAPSSISQQSVQIANNLGTLEQFLKTYPAVAVFFTSASCPPCQTIKPEFQNLIRDKNQGTSNLRILGAIVDTSIAFDAGAKFGIRATPTFMFFHKGEKVAEFRGANYAELKSSIDLLLFTAYPPHPHRTINLRHVCNAENLPILYKDIGKIDMIVSKLESYIGDNNLSLDEKNKSTLYKAKDVLFQGNGSLSMYDWQILIDHLTSKLPLNHQFPLLDIFRSIILTEDAGNYYTSNSNKLADLMDIVNKNESTVPKATWLMILRSACNIFSHQVLVTTYFTSHLESSHRSHLTQLLITSLLAEDIQVRQTAASLAYNCSTTVMTERLRKEKNGGGDNNININGIAEQEDDDWQVEIISAVMDALTKENDSEIIHRLLACISKFIFLSPTESSVPNLLSALDILSILEDKKKIIQNNKNALELTRDIRLMVQKSESL